MEYVGPESYQCYTTEQSREQQNTFDSLLWTVKSEFYSRPYTTISIKHGALIIIHYGENRFQVGHQYIRVPAWLPRR